MTIGMERNAEGHRVSGNVIYLSKSSDKGYIDTNDRIIRSSSAEIKECKAVSFLRRVISLNAGLEILSQINKDKLPPHKFLRLSKSWNKVSLGGGIEMCSGEEDETFLGLVREGIRVITHSTRTGNNFTDYDAYIGKAPTLKTAWKLVNMGEDINSITATLERMLSASKALKS